MFAPDGPLRMPDYLPAAPAAAPSLRPDPPSRRSSASLSEDPLGFVERMLAALDGGDEAGYRALLQEASTHPAAHSLRAQAIATVYAGEALAARPLAAPQAMPAPVRRGPRLC